MSTRAAMNPAHHGPALHRPLPLPLGERLAGRYELVAVIGQGALATVYRALDHARRKRPVALKVAEPHAVTGDDCTLLAQHEAAVLHALDHPGVVRHLDSSSHGTLPYLAMPLLSGVTLADALRRSAPAGFPPRESLRILRTIADALDHIHARGFVHGDLKTGNIVVSRHRIAGFTHQAAAILIDFGSARRLDRAIGPDMADGDRRIDALGLFAPSYASPERLRGESARIGDDLYSLAVLAHILLVRRHPFDQRNALEAMGETGAIQPPAEIAARPALALARALALDPAQRPASASRLIEELTLSPFAALRWRLSRLRPGSD